MLIQSCDIQRVNFHRLSASGVRNWKTILRRGLVLGASVCLYHFCASTFRRMPPFEPPEGIYCTDRLLLSVAAISLAASIFRNCTSPSPARSSAFEMVAAYERKHRREQREVEGLLLILMTDRFSFTLGTDHARLTFLFRSFNDELCTFGLLLRNLFGFNSMCEFFTEGHMRLCRSEQ